MNRRPSQYTRPASSPWFAVKTNCTECNRPRASGGHAKCSRARQMRFADENQGDKKMMSI